MDSTWRMEKDSMGEVRVPAGALYGATTQRAVDNFPISGRPMPRAFLRALGMVKRVAAEVNRDLGLLPADVAGAIVAAAQEVEAGKHDAEFPIDVFQTGSGTSTNMNANEVIGALASKRLGKKVHPNDHVNMGQSSNDAIPTALHVSAALQVHEKLLPALLHLKATIETKAGQAGAVVKTGRTHLMDAMPVRLGQQMSGWAHQVQLAIERVQATLPRVHELAQGGTAVGTGVNAHPEFAERFAGRLAAATGIAFRRSRNFFASLAAPDSIVELSGQLKATAAGLTKICNDLRWMNSGPIAGLGEIALPALQPGSSIMPGKVNPVIPEATLMVCAQVVGNDAAILVGGQSGTFELNVMLPLLARNVLESVELLAAAALLLADKAIAGFTVNTARITELVDKNPILVTALNPVIGYEKGSALAKKAYQEGRRLIDVAAEETKLSRDELKRLLDPAPMCDGGIVEGAGGG
ncbi:MAG TPA: class II fumarate hydratase [Planctomycetota bacterium]|jgi:fumarate hydratase class II|nr:class II fumarate hydratase [Planctomycetota bacterium]